MFSLRMATSTCFENSLTCAARYKLNDVKYWFSPDTWRSSTMCALFKERCFIIFSCGFIACVATIGDSVDGDKTETPAVNVFKNPNNIALFYILGIYLVVLTTIWSLLLCCCFKIYARKKNSDGEDEESIEKQMIEVTKKMPPMKLKNSRVTNSNDEFESDEASSGSESESNGEYETESDRETESNKYTEFDLSSEAQLEDENGALPNNVDKSRKQRQPTLKRKNTSAQNIAKNSEDISVASVTTEPRNNKAEISDVGKQGNQPQKQMNESLRLTNQLQPTHPENPTKDPLRPQSQVNKPLRTPNQSKPPHPGSQMKKPLRQNQMNGPPRPQNQATEQPRPQNQVGGPPPKSQNKSDNPPRPHNKLVNPSRPQRQQNRLQQLQNERKNGQQSAQEAP